jgi:hypothetical protein
VAAPAADPAIAPAVAAVADAGRRKDEQIVNLKYKPLESHDFL